jgi:hypothetical protein
MNTTVEQTIVQQLNQTKVNGFPLLQYIGTQNQFGKSINVGYNTVIIKPAKNPKKITSVAIQYMEISDTYTIRYYKKNQVVMSQDDMYCDQLSSIARELGVL